MSIIEMGYDAGRGVGVTAISAVFGKKLGKSRVCEVEWKVLCQIYAKEKVVGVVAWLKN